MATKKSEAKGMTNTELKLKLEQDGVIKPTTAKKTSVKKPSAAKAKAATKEAPKAEAKPEAKASKPAPKKSAAKKETPKPKEKSLKVAAKKPAPKKSAEKAPAQAKRPSRDKIFPKEFDFGEFKLTRLDVKDFSEASKILEAVSESEDGKVMFLCTHWPKSTLLDYEGNCLPRYRMAPPTKGFEHDLDVSQVAYLQERKDLGIARFVCFSSVTSSTTAIYESQMKERTKEGYFLAFDVEAEFYIGTPTEAE